MVQDKVVLGSREDGDDVADELPVNARCFHAHACGQCPSFSLNRRMWSRPRPGHNPIAVVRDRELDPVPLAY